MCNKQTCPCPIPPSLSPPTRPIRSPWTNSYDPPLSDGTMPSERLRKLEVDANAAFDQYREMYFEGGVSSVYLWDLDNGFAGVILIKKAGDPGSKKIKVEIQTWGGGGGFCLSMIKTDSIFHP